MIVRVTEQIATVEEVSYDVTIPGDIPNSEGDDNIEDYLDRERDFIHREIIQRNAEIIGVEET